MNAKLKQIIQHAELLEKIKEQCPVPLCSGSSNSIHFQNQKDFLDIVKDEGLQNSIVVNAVTDNYIHHQAITTDGIVLIYCS